MAAPSTDSQFPVLYLPVEHIQRELDGKLLLALEAVRRGYQVVLGEHERLNKRLKKLPVGAYLYKDAASWQASKLFPTLKAAGYKVLALDEEGLIYRDEQAYLSGRVDARAVQNLDVLFAWGALHRDTLLRMPEINPDIIRVVGNPRMDLCRLTPIRAQDSGKFNVLVNTRFTIVNSHKSTAQLLESLRRMKVITNDSDEQFYACFVERDTVLLAMFVDAVRQLAALGTHLDIVVRPHPGESSDYYRNAFADLTNVRVDNSTALVQHLAAADIILHEGCTTAIEGALMGKPSVTLADTPSLTPNLDLPNRFSTRVESVEAAVTLIDAASRTPAQPPTISDEALSALKNARGEFAFSLIADAIDALDLPPAASAPMRPILQRGQWLKDAKLRWKEALYIRLLPRLLNKSPSDISRKAGSFANKYAKFPPLDTHQFQQRLEEIRQVFPGDVAVSSYPIDAQTFLLTPQPGNAHAHTTGH